jgi:phosphatidylglycerol:prolipoprotein diacylglycerol transferase
MVAETTMRPTLLDLPLPGGLHFAFGAYGTMLALGMLAAAWVSGRHGRLLGLRRRDAFDLGLWLLAAGVLGAHLLYIASNCESYFAGGGEAGPGWTASLRRGGLAYYGGLAAAFPVLWLWGRRRGIPYPDLLDFVAPLGALGLAVTRVGCFLNGCCYGEPTGLPWAVVFPPGSQPQQAQTALGLIAPGAPSLPVHPVQLYECAAALAMFAWQWARFPRRRFAGEVVAAFGFLYGSWRFAIEWLRADSDGWRPGAHALNSSQVLSLVVIALAALGWWAVRRAARRPWSQRLPAAGAPVRRGAESLG